MKVLLLVLLFGSFVLGDEYRITTLEEISIDSFNSIDEGDNKTLCYKDKKYELGNPDEDAEIDRPCQVYDMFCIRRYFAKHSKCKESYGPEPSPLYRAQSIFHLPGINLTVISSQVQYFGNIGRITEFYVNKKTDKLVLAVEFTNVRVYPKDNFLIFHRRAKEPIVNVGVLNVTYSSLVITLVIPNLKDLQFDKSEQFTYNFDDTPRFVFDPRLFLSSDPVTLETAGPFFRLALIIREGFLTDGTFLIGNYVKYNICDFGIDVI